ncbi:Vegetative incompatibility protein HET-E-1 [Ophiocordyceps camponoti-floridani]|uniref:Vegetative incompatibility protein HET-E-1 n=1 Tax=Ophiocordyceps camponoti-floridani TaxID=2030778 RepID=A0A8H4QAV9_9HYPO|nr:Vegetative incompatibility protein HET-E-1 [Ophiocordyceps camponoti-floridani]
MTTLEDASLYTIGWIAALPIERAAATALLDDRHDPPRGFDQHTSDTNSYTWGRMGAHNIVIASLPAGIYGTTSAATTASNLVSSLPQIKIGLLVGIGAGLVRPDSDIRLGDVVVSQPHGTNGGVVQYDLGKAEVDGKWEAKGSLNMPPQVLLSALANLQAEHEISASNIPELLRKMLTKNPKMGNAGGFVHQGVGKDRLFVSTYAHQQGHTCEACDANQEIKRQKRSSTDPEIHYGIIASGNKLIKDAVTRDEMAAFLGHDCLCFEMEAAGLMNHFPCLVIRGICDYADSHKNDGWQRYASAAAAAYAKELLGFVPVKQLQATRRAVDVLSCIGDQVDKIQAVTTDVRDDVQGVRTVLLDIEQKATLRRLEPRVVDFHAEDREPTCLAGTRVEILDEISAWATDAEAESIFWLMGTDGTGKSTIARTVARSRDKSLGATFFFKRDDSDRGNLSRFFSTVAAELTKREPAMASYIHKAALEKSQLYPPTEAAATNTRGIRQGFFRERFNKLILRPLQMVAPALRTDKPVVLVVDGLDECEPEGDARILIELLLRAVASHSLRLKVLLTSRPKLRARFGMLKNEALNQELVLRRMPTDETDLLLLVTHELARIRDEFNDSGANHGQLTGDWPGDASIEALVKMAAPVFVSAVTMCRFIADDKMGTPDEQLRKILTPRRTGEQASSQLDAAYLPVLDNLVENGQRKTQLDGYHNIMGPLVILTTPLSSPSLAHLLDLDQDDVDNLLNALHAVLHIPPSATDPVSLRHLSFADWILNRKPCPEQAFIIDESKAHGKVAIDCLRVMTRTLKRNMCGTNKGMRANRATIGQRRIDACIPHEVQYACVNWVHHVEKAGRDGPSTESIYAFLEAHRLHWMETLGILERGGELVRYVETLQSFMKTQHDSEGDDASKGQLSELLSSFVPFAAAMGGELDSTPRHVYTARSGA